MRQRWRNILHVHWKVDQRLIAQALPTGLEPVEPWLSLVALRVGNVGGLLGMIAPHFQELNFRAYVRGPGGPGIYYFSLECSHRLHVKIARAATGLALRYSRIGRNEEGGRVAVYSPTVEIRASIGEAAVEDSLAEPRLLYSVRRGMLLELPIERADLRLRRVTVEHLEEQRAREFALPAAAPPFVASFADGAEVSMQKPHISCS